MKGQLNMLRQLSICLKNQLSKLGLYRECMNLHFKPYNKK